MSGKKQSKLFKRSFGDNLLRNVTLTVVTIFIIFPYFWMVSTSLKPSVDISLSPPRWLPSVVEWSNYVKVWLSIPLLRYIGNSTFVAVLTTVISLLLSSMAAYSLSCLRPKITGFAISLFMFTQLVPFTLPLIALYRMLFAARLTNTYQGLIICYSVGAIPFCILMMRGYYSKAVPQSLVESARIDGCSQFGTYLRIGLPLAVPGLVATSIFAFNVAWNDFVWASIILIDAKKKTASVGIYDFIDPFFSSNNVAFSMSAAVLITIPSMLLFSFLQQHLVSGLTAGAVKE